MFCQNLTLMPLNHMFVRMFRNRHFQSYIRSAAFSRFAFSAKNLNIKCHVNSSRYLQSFNFHTSNKCYASEHSKEENTQRLVKMTVVTAVGKEYEIKGEVGSSVMEAAIKNKDVHEKMEAACDGQLACTTCHVYVEDKFKKLFSETSQEEDDLLDNAPFIKPTSRLSCQLVISENIEGAKFVLPMATSNFSVDKKGKKHG